MIGMGNEKTVIYADLTVQAHFYTKSRKNS